MKGYSLNNSKVGLALLELDFSGNIIPLEWFNHLRYPNGKAHSIAILLLSDIVYWYRPIEVRDEETGALKGYTKKFKADLLQRNYDAFADQYGYTHNQVKDAVVYLEDLGLVKRHFRTVPTSSGTLGNVLFIELFSEKVKYITLPGNIPLWTLKFTGVETEVHRGEDTGSDPVDFKGQTLTETTPETTPEITVDSRAPKLDDSEEEEGDHVQATRSTRSFRPAPKPARREKKDKRSYKRERPTQRPELLQPEVVPESFLPNLQVDVSIICDVEGFTREEKDSLNEIQLNCVPFDKGAVTLPTYTIDFVEEILVWAEKKEKLGQSVGVAGILTALRNPDNMGKWLEARLGGAKKEKQNVRSDRKSDGENHSVSWQF